MTKNISIVLIGIALITGCAKPYIAVSPSGFAHYSTKREFRTISPEGVVYRVRDVKNKPYAEFSFWCEAFKRRMIETGYRSVSDTVDHENKRAVYEFAAPVENQDFSYLIGIIPAGKRIVIIEAAGEAVLFSNHRSAVVKAMQELKVK